MWRSFTKRSSSSVHRHRRLSITSFRHSTRRFASTELTLNSPALSLHSSESSIYPTTKHLSCFNIYAPKTMTPPFTYPLMFTPSAKFFSFFQTTRQLSSASAKKSKQSTSQFNITDKNQVRLSNIRNVGVFAHVDAGKTTVTERMLALSGIVHRAGSVDDGNTVTDFLPAERERGITIQSAAISFNWDQHNSIAHKDNPTIQINLIDTPGHVDFTVEVNRSVAVLDGAVLVVDAVAGVQAQTETVWKALSRTSLSSSSSSSSKQDQDNKLKEEALPCVALINKMDKDGSHFMSAIQSIKHKLSGANPVPIQLPLFQLDTLPSASSPSLSASASLLPPDIVAIPLDDKHLSANTNTYAGRANYVGAIDLIHMRAIIYPNITSSQVADVEQCIPDVINLMDVQSIDEDYNLDKYSCSILQMALQARMNLVAELANYNEEMEECFLMEHIPTSHQLLQSIRQCTIERHVLPVLSGAALRGKGVEPVLDAIADFLPSPLDRLPPALIRQYNYNLQGQKQKHSKQNPKQDNDDHSNCSSNSNGHNMIPLGHPLHPTLLALAFKVVHMKNRGGSGDGRVVFARVYSGTLHAKDVLNIVSSSMNISNTKKNVDLSQDSLSISASASASVHVERIGGMLELSGGRFGNLEQGICESGGVCALIGLKNVVTGDTLLLNTDFGKKDKKHKNTKSQDSKNDLKFEYKHKLESTQHMKYIQLAGVSSPKPVLTMRMEASSSQDQAKLSNALHLLSIEDPSLHVEENETSTLVSGLGELHMEVTLDRLKREFQLDVMTGKPAVAYRETILKSMETNGLCVYDRTIGDTRLQASIHVVLKTYNDDYHNCNDGNHNLLLLSEPVVTLGSEVRKYLELDELASEEDLYYSNPVAKALLSGCRGSLRRGAYGPYPMANVHCHVVNVQAEGGVSYLYSMPGALRAAAAHAISSLLTSSEGQQKGTVLEPTMQMEITVPPLLVGMIVSDLTTRRGLIGEVMLDNQENNDTANTSNSSSSSSAYSKALIKADVPLVEILGYASSLRSLTGGEGIFSAEYKGHSPCEKP